MDCSHARLLLLFSRPAEQSGQDLAWLQGHLEQCGDCLEQARKDKLVDDAVGRAMRAVAAPTGLSSRILHGLERARRPRPWTWLATAAALLLTIGLGVAWYHRPAPHISEPDFVVVSDLSQESVADWLKSEGFGVEVPHVIDLAYLDSCEMVSIQGRRVPKLLYVNHAHGSVAVAHVYVISRHDFRWDSDLVKTLSTGSRSADLQPSAVDDNFSFLVIYSAGSHASFPRRGGDGV